MSVKILTQSALREYSKFVSQLFQMFSWKKCYRFVLTHPAAFNHYLFFQNTPSYISDRVPDTALHHLRWFKLTREQCWKICINENIEMLLMTYFSKSKWKTGNGSELCGIFCTQSCFLNVFLLWLLCGCTVHE